MHSSLLVSILVATAAYAQTITITSDGVTVVAVQTLDGLGLPTTSVVETLAAEDPLTTETTATTAATATTQTTRQVTTLPPVPQGPVGQPAQTSFVPGGAIPYTYTTVVGGVTQTLSDLFTPTSLQQLPTSIGASGTVWDYSEWSAVYLPKSTASGSSNAAVALLGAGGAWAGVLLSGMIAVIGGIGLLAL